MLRRTRHAGLGGRHCRDIFWGVWYVAGIDAIFVASRLGCVQTGLDVGGKQNGRIRDRKSALPV